MTPPKDCCDSFVGDPHTWDCEEAILAELPRAEGCELTPCADPDSHATEDHVLSVVPGIGPITAGMRERDRAAFVRAMLDPEPRLRLVRLREDPDRIPWELGTYRWTGKNILNYMARSDGFEVEK